LKTVLGTFRHKHENATLTVTEVKELKGDSAVSIRKQKKIVTYDYNIMLLWKCDMSDAGNTKVLGTIEGQYEMPEMSNDILDDGEEWEINTRIVKAEDSTLVSTLT
jgi:activator of HSP90 ATPase